MNKYETIIFDLDDTLIDNNESIKYALMTIIEKLGIDYTDELFYRWKNFDNAYWHNWESGKMILPDTIETLEDKITYLRANRFLMFFYETGINFNNAVSINKLYCSMLGENVVEIKDACQLLKELNQKHEIVIATNGPQAAALNKLEKANLISYISALICSEEIGYSKPMPEYFNYLCNITKNKDKNKMLLVGDSLTTDILGGMNNGIDTCWFNPNNNPLPEEYNPTMTIGNLLELKRKI